MSRKTPVRLEWDGRVARSAANRLYAVGVADRAWLKLVWDDEDRPIRVHIAADPGRLVLVKRTNSGEAAAVAAKRAVREGRGPAAIFSLVSGRLLAVHE